MKRTVTSILRSHPGRFLSHHMFDAVTKTHLALVDTSSSFLASPVLSCVSAGTADPQPGIPSVAEQGCFRRPEHGGVGDDRVQTYVRAPFIWSPLRPKSTLRAAPTPGACRTAPLPAPSSAKTPRFARRRPALVKPVRSYKRVGTTANVQLILRINGSGHSV